MDFVFSTNLIKFYNYTYIITKPILEMELHFYLRNICHILETDGIYYNISNLLFMDL